MPGSKGSLTGLSHRAIMAGEGAPQSWSNGSKSHIFATTVFPHKFTTMTPHTEPGYLCRVASLPSLAAAGAPKKPANAMPHKPEWFEENLSKMVEDREKQRGGFRGLT